MVTERGASTRQTLLDAATRVFSDRGFAGATTKEIAAAAGVSEGTIYRHFSDKNELFHAALIERREVRSEAFEQLHELVGTGTVRDNLRRLVRAVEEVEDEVAPMMAAVWSDGDLREALLTAGVGGPGGPGSSTDALGHVARYLAAEQDVGRVKRDADPAQAAFALFAIPFTAVLTSRMARSQGIEPQVDMMGALDVVLDGLLPGDGPDEVGGS